ncbi:MAG: hypothetical protein ABSE57_29830 [Bryobacteraceae bacterium]|jgi:hypothetical protein
MTDKDGALLPPVMGQFEIAEFYGADVDGGRTIRVRFVSSKMTSSFAQSEQAVSHDKGKAGTNWSMMTRID